MEYEPSSEYLASPGFAGVLVLVAAVLACIVWVITARIAGHRAVAEGDDRQRRHDAHHADVVRAAAIERCWLRFAWLVETAGVEPTAADTDTATLGVGPELALEMLQGLRDDAESLEDKTLSGAIAIYLTQYALVMGQQAGRLPAPPQRVRARTTASQSAKPAESVADKPASNGKQTPTSPAKGAAS
ncbi:hypothetical protein KIH27_18610 [Mycobacterium sp. M1]|uniref:Uncharacterized protein n=1 Tax=Mycolicibacter acidiphilus TaxID=2835306 RepID=A0ABS5RNK6_9MYCO|nr:hypothetical protein [Mycolicibacter acidiphilus]MBS9535602.1 hypothetical protein [Mycolicibacter acidiphilus]